MGKKLVLVVSSEKDKQQLYVRNVQILIRGTFIWQFKCTCHTFASVATKTLSAAVCRQAWSYFWRPPILLGQHADISLRSALYVASTVDMQWPWESTSVHHLLVHEPAWQTEHLTQTSVPGALILTCCRPGPLSQIPTILALGAASLPQTKTRPIKNTQKTTSKRNVSYT